MFKSYFVTLYFVFVRIQWKEPLNCTISIGHKIGIKLCAIDSNGWLAGSMDRTFSAKLWSKIASPISAAGYYRLREFGDIAFTVAHDGTLHGTISARLCRKV